jgi:hypothetical protein
MGQNQRFMKKLKIDFLRMSLILYLVSIQLYYVWVLDFREISTIIPDFLGEGNNQEKKVCI